MSLYYDQDLQLTKEAEDDYRIWNGRNSVSLTDKQVKELNLVEPLFFDIFKSRGE